MRLSHVERAADRSGFSELRICRLLLHSKDENGSNMLQNLTHTLRILA